ncbi:hypothetical protein XA68_13295 [Ophiocordyceps unilateralis]|uniref:Rhodanese domain-containing protein n=1 Tax=Ophiocordyceps unilateralis TaxID=268505 RepID=A0A2A9PB39_OPHUN|nr:hypothetical protein XA68_13295 [Ophiocordyceps unilateralis]
MVTNASSSSSSSAPPLAGYEYNYFRVTRPGPWSQTAHVEMNRAEKLNGFVPDMWRELGDVFRRLGRDSDVKVVVLSGAGERAFTAGLDVRAAGEAGILVRKEEKEGGDAARRAWMLRGVIEEFQACVGEVERCEKPVICVMHGIALGLAIDIATCADIRLCAQATRFAVKEVDIGIAADIGTLARLPKTVGSSSWVKDVCLTGRDFSAQEALSVGFVSQVHDDKQAALRAAFALADVLAEKSPVAVQGTKELLNYGAQHSTAESLRYTAVWNSVAIQTADVAVAMGKSKKKDLPFAKL